MLKKFSASLFVIFKFGNEISNIISLETLCLLDDVPLPKLINLFLNSSENSFKQINFDSLGFFDLKTTNSGLQVKLKFISGTRTTRHFLGFIQDIKISFGSHSFGLVTV